MEQSVVTRKRADSPKEAKSDKISSLLKRFFGVEAQRKQVVF